MAAGSLGACDWHVGVIPSANRERGPATQDTQEVHLVPAVRRAVGEGTDSLERSGEEAGS